LGFDRNTLPGTASSILPITWHPLLSAASSRGRLDWGLIGILCLAERRRSCPTPGILPSQRHRAGAGWIGVYASIHRRRAVFWGKPSVDGTVRSAATSPRQRVQRNFNVGTIPSLSSTRLIQPTNGRRDRPSSKERVELTGFQAFQGTSYGALFPVPAFPCPLSWALFQVPSLAFPPSGFLILVLSSCRNPPKAVRVALFATSATIVLSPTFSARHHLQSRAIRL